jgi:hypothetical protein
MSIALATKGIIYIGGGGAGQTITITGPPSEEIVYVLDMAVAVSLEELEVQVIAEDLDLLVAVDDLEVPVEITEDDEVQIEAEEPTVEVDV